MVPKKLRHNNLVENSLGTLWYSRLIAKKECKSWWTACSHQIVEPHNFERNSCFLFFSTSKQYLLFFIFNFLHILTKSQFLPIYDIMICQSLIIIPLEHLLCIFWRIIIALSVIIIQYITQGHHTSQDYQNSRNSSQFIKYDHDAAIKRQFGR